ncbi:MAG: phosphomannomutase/phosphoglucomutase [Candidatus Magasanikbacteria bacterium]|nr:phosphomannomutase/phosphoglucomutase [Candidatus Magasanikbacteria bacterium]
MRFNNKIFKAYDIRGLVNGDLSAEFAYRVGRAFVVFLKNKNIDFSGKKIVVGKDMRETSEEFANAVIKGINYEGIDVVKIGLTSTPLFNFACAHYSEHVGGIMVTASHNPSEYNGFKITQENGLPVGKVTGMDEIKDLVLNYEFKDAEEKGGVEDKSIFEDYKNLIFSLVPKESIKPLKIVVDGGNGMADVSIPKVLAELPIEVEYMYMEPDGTFPNHEANPLKVETLKDLQKKVVEVGADFGFAFDGDADRIGLVDENGEVVPASFVGGLVGLEVLAKHPNSVMLYDLRLSQSVKEIWEENGAKTQMCMVGHALIKDLMKKTGAVFAGELSLHLYYSDVYDLESTDLSLLYFLHIMSREGKKLSELIKPFKRYVHSDEINFEVEDKDGVMKKVEESFKDSALETSYLDGLWMRFDWGWLSLRKSNTEPVLRLNLEARNKEEVKDKVEELKVFLS